MLKNLISGSGPPLAFSSTSSAVGTLHLVAVEPAVAGIDGRPLVSLGGRVVVSRLAVVLHPVVRRGAPDEAEQVVVEIEEDRVADHIAVVVAGHELLGLVDGEILKAVDGEIGQQSEGVRAFDVQVRHVVRLVEEAARRAPCMLLVAPVGELARIPRVHVRPDLRVAREVDRAPGLQDVLKASRTHDCEQLLFVDETVGGLASRRAYACRSRRRSFRTLSRACSFVKTPF